MIALRTLTPLASLAAFAALLGAAAPVSAAPPRPLSDAGLSPPEGRPPQPTRVIVRFRADADSGERAAARRAAGTALDRPLPLPRTQLVNPEPGIGVGAAVARLERSPDVLYAEPDAVRTIAAAPNDEFFPRLWGLHNTGQILYDGDTAGTADADIDAPEAWDLTTGSPAVAVGVIDTGVDATHPDLAPNRWTNDAEAGGAAGVDDDGNGKVDDVHGYDWVQGDATPQDAEGHGTHVAGTIGARGDNGRGVAGVAWASELAPLRVLDGNGSGAVSDVIDAYDYARRTGLPIVNASFGGDDPSNAERDAIAAASGTLFVVAAGNAGANNDAPGGGEYPCNYTLTNMICVAASDDEDELASFSNYGATSVDLAAPGVDIASTVPCGWEYSNGTSMAAPHVAGTAALVKSVAPGATPLQLRDAVLDNVEQKPDLIGAVETGGRLNAADAVASVTGSTPGPLGATAAGELCPPVPPPPPPPPPDTTGPVVSISSPSRQRMSTVFRRGLRPRLHPSEAATVTATLEVGARTARRYGLTRRNRAVRIGSVTRTWNLPETRTVTIRLSRRVRQRLGRARSFVTALRVRATDLANNPSTRSKSIRLRR